MSLSTSRIRKRKYSRNGCKECKRRKIKCDETYPACNNCSRLNKTCVYDLSIIQPRIGDLPSSKAAGTLRMQMYQSIDLTKTKVSKSTSKKNSIRNSKANTQTSPSSIPETGVVAVDGTKMAEPVLQHHGPNNHTDPKITPKLEYPSAEISSTTAMASGMSSLNSVTLNLNSVGLDGPHVPKSINGSVRDSSIFIGDINPYEDPDLVGLFNRAYDLVHDMNQFLVTGEGEQINNNTGPIIDSNNFVTSVPDSAEASSRDSTAPVDFSEYDICLEPTCNPSPNGITERLLLSNSELIQNCVTEHTLAAPHTEYLETLTNTDLSYHIFPYASLIESNGGVKLLLIYLAKCTYLLSSILAISATFQFNQTGRLRHDSARRIYTSKCLKTLSDAFAEYSSFSDATILASNIELLLLTILVLSSCFTATRYSATENHLNKWQTHLKGARDLLIDYSQKTRLHSSCPSLCMTSGLAFAKCWFFAIESLSVLHTSVGRPFLQTSQQWDFESGHSTDIYEAEPFIGTNPEYEVWLDTGTTEANANATYHNALERAGLICKTMSGADFNLFWGYTSTAVRLIITIDSIRHAIALRQMTHVPSRWTMHVISLIDGLLSDRIVPEVTYPTFEVITPKTEHGYASLANRLGIPDACFSTEVDELGTEHTYSWFDASCQFLSRYFYLNVLTSDYFLALPRTHPQVQELLHTIFKGFFFIKLKNLPQYATDEPNIFLQSENFYLTKTMFDYHCIMFQSIFRVISGAVVDDKDFEKIDLFFMGLVKLGNGSALSFLDNVTRFKELRRANQENNPGVVDDKVYDLYHFSSDIPFA